MYLYNKKGYEFRLEINGYQFPHILDRYWDSNWLSVRLSGINSRGSWNVDDPCLLTFEVESLVSWLQKIIVDRVSQPRKDFLEPNLKFCVIKHRLGNYFMRVDLGDIVLRKMIPEAFGDEKFIRLYFPLDEIDLPDQAQSLRTQLSKYPQRVFR